jgi:hypothetical protein
MLDAGYWILDAGYWILDTGYWMFDLGTRKNPFRDSMSIET